MIKLTCLLKRREGTTPAEFQAYWKEHHAATIVGTKCGSHVIRYEQNPRPLDDYRDDDDRSGYDGVTVQWFANMDEYYAHMNEPDSPRMFEDIPKFLDPDALEFVLTEEPRVIIDGSVDWAT
jgi:rhamnose utilization protein RhaD (predicted bifunctional aldolase and dehydrogenase)